MPSFWIFLVHGKLLLVLLSVSKVRRGVRIITSSLFCCETVANQLLTSCVLCFIFLHRLSDNVCVFAKSSISIVVGGMLCSFSPCIEQVQKTLQAMNQENCFYRMRTMEILLRPYDIWYEKVKELGGAETLAPRIKPSDEIRGHTGYLTFAQKVKFA